MTILTREKLIDGSFRSDLDMPPHLSWSDADLERSLSETLKARRGGPIWVSHDSVLRHLPRQ